MSATMSDLRPAAVRRLRRGVIAGATVLAVALAMLVAGFLIFWGPSWHEPRFASLAAHPDTSLQGTVAYYADRTGCVRIVAAAGRPSRTVLCIPQQQDVGKAQKLGKLIGPQLVWLARGRLQVTMFRMTPPAKPGAVPAYHKGWQKIIDVRAGRITNVPAAALPDRPDLTTHPAVSPAGQRITWMSSDGRVKIRLNHGSGSRVLLSVQGPPETYRLGAAFWAPNWNWITADDGRILIITTGRHPVTRVLTAESTRIVFEQRFARFAVTSANLLPPAG